MVKKMEISKDNHGMALVSVIIIITLISIMAGALLQASYMAYSRKVVERRSTENFYSAESVVDTIKSVVQNCVSEAVSEAQTSDEAFAKAAFAALLNMDKTTITSSSYANVDDPAVQALKNLLWKNIIKDSNGNAKTDESFYNGYETTTIQAALTALDEGGNGGAFDILGDDQNHAVVVEESGIRIKNVYIKFVNNEGYTAEITTDIVVNAPVYASSITVPVGTYSMFAGNGATISAARDSGSMSNQPSASKIQADAFTYIHQEGNVYVGTGDDGIALLLSNGGNKQGGGVASFGGTNIVVNGDIKITDGNTLIFTGGNGLETTYIEVKGDIILEKGGTLLLPQNCQLICRSILNADGSLYTGTGAQSSVSQFYPFAQSYVVNKGGTVYSTDYLTGDADIPEVLEYIRNTKDTSSDFLYSNIDARFKSVVCDTNPANGVYIMDHYYDNTLWTTDERKAARSASAYQLLKYSSVSGWSCDTANIFTSQIIYDPEEAAEEKVEYVVNGETKKYDPEFVDIVNVPLLVNLDMNDRTTKLLTDYPTTASGADNFAKLKLTQTAFNGAYAGAINKFDWTNINLSFNGREIKVPTSKTTKSFSASDYAFTLDGGIQFIADSVNVGTVAQTNIQNISDKVMFYVSNNSFTVRTTGDYAGLFMSSADIYFGGSTGAHVYRGISLIELAEKVRNSEGNLTNIDDVKNPVRQYLTTISAGLCGDLNSGTSYSTNDLNYIALDLVDNAFNGGISIFWDRDSKDDEESKEASEQNSLNDFIQTDNWKKN